MTEASSLLCRSSSRLAVCHSLSSRNLASKSSSRNFSRGAVTSASLGSVGTSGAPAKSEEMVRDSELPLREIPGGYGIPYVSQLVNRWRYLFFEKEPAFWTNRMKRYNSTVLRTNMPPGWPWTDSRVVMFLDQKSYPTVFDNEKVDKYKAFAGTYMPSTGYTGGLELCAYLDPSDKKHEQLKGWCFELLKQSASKWAPEFRKAITNAFLQWEYKIEQKQLAPVNPTLPEALFRFMINAITTADFDDPRVPDSEKPLCADLQKWTAFQLVPIGNAGLPFYLEELLHVAPIPARLTKGGYDKFVAFLQNYADETLTSSEQHGLTKEEAVHNLIFFLVLNGHGGFCRFFPIVIQQVGLNPALQEKIRAEVRAATKGDDGRVTMKAVMSDMPLVASTVYEALRFLPPVPFQYARAKKDFIVESHDARFQIKAGEFLGGCNYMVSRDPKVFKEDPEKFVAERFMGPEREKLLHHLVWSNGRQTDETTVWTKQCAGKDIVPLTGRLLLAEMFMRYDSFTVKSNEGLDKNMAFTSLQRRDPSSS
ncbi:hypothetical protein M758_UG086500 [Ceratodon purpureus]|nr:hypothetical protein M758_UG086500 [Ceratodon purpureus]